MQKVHQPKYLQLLLILQEIVGQDFFNKIGDFAKKTWNGENGMGKTGNRAAIIGAGALATVGTAAYLNKKRNEKKEEEMKYKNYR